MNDFKNTGHFHLVDAKGRVVLPKDICIQKDIKNGDRVEFLIGPEGVLLCKASHISFLPSVASACLTGLLHLKNIAGAVCNSNQVVASSGAIYEDLVGLPVSHEAQEAFSGIETYTCQDQEEMLLVSSRINTAIECAVPIIENGQACGYVVIFVNESNLTGISEKLICARLIASILANWSG